jgi:DNA-binding NarL/FixJ family response regulator
MAPDTQSLTVLMADDHLVVSHGIQKLLKDCVQRIEAVPTGEALLEAIALEQPDVVLLDIGMPGISGIETLVRLRLLGFKVPVVMLTMYDDMAMVGKAIAAGAIGYVVKQASGDELLTAIACAVHGEMFISPSINFYRLPRQSPEMFVPSSAQVAVVRLAADGLRAKQVAAELGLSCRTVESHKYAMMQQLGIGTTIELISWAKKHGYI